MPSRLKYHERRPTEAYTLCYENVLLASYLWDVHAIEAGVPTASMESHGFKMAFVCLKRAGVERSRSRRKFAEDQVVQTVAHSLSEQVKIMMTVYKCS